MVKIGVLIPEKLRDAMESKYASDRMSLSEQVTRAVAQLLGHPELGEVPWPLRGRKRKKQPREATSS